MQIFFCFSFLCFFFSIPLARADCSNPSGGAGDILYNIDHTVMQYCNDTDWIAMGVNSSDNLGNHIATQALDMSGNRINNVTNPAAAQDAATKFYVDSLTGTNETDPQVGTLTSTKWCTANGTSINCTTNAPILTELDPQVGTLANTKWCTTNGTSINCTSNTPILTEVDPQVGTLTNARWCTTNGTTINCTSNAPGGVGASVIEDLTNVDTAGKSVNDVLSWNGTNWVDKSISITETDPQVTTVTNNKWCRGNGSAVVCDQNVPVMAETDPQVNTVTSGKWCKGISGNRVRCTYNAPSGNGPIPTSAVPPTSCNISHVGERYFDTNVPSIPSEPGLICTCSYHAEYAWGWYGEYIFSGPGGVAYLKC